MPGIHALCLIGAWPKTSIMMPSLFTRRFLFIIFLIVARVSAVTSVSDVFLFSYFVGNGEDGLHLATSVDGFKREVLRDGASFLEPVVGKHQ